MDFDKTMSKEVSSKFVKLIFKSLNNRRLVDFKVLIEIDTFQVQVFIQKYQALE